MSTPTPTARLQRPRFIRVAVWLARCLVLLMLFGQGAVVELAHAFSDASGCEDDVGDECPCDTNCHCCLDCARSASPVLPTVFDPRVESELSFVQLGDFLLRSGPSSLDLRPPLKVPKPAA